MEDLKNINESNIYSFMNEIKYGSNLVTYENDEARVIMLKNIEIICEILGAGALEEIQYVDTVLEQGSYIDNVVDGVYNILYRVRYEFPLLKETDYRVSEYLLTAIDQKSKVNIPDLNDNLHKYAFRTAKQLGVKFGLDVSGYYFNAQEKQKPIYKQLEDAYASGLESISFDSEKTHTVRCYASTLGNSQGKKFRCSVANKKITVYFKEMNKSDQLFNKLNLLYNEFVPFIGKTGFNEAINRMDLDVDWDEKVSGNMILGKMIDTNQINLEESKAVPYVNEYYEETETDRDYEAEALGHKIQIPANEEWFLADGKITPIRDVEGLKQYFIPELEADNSGFDKERSSDETVVSSDSIYSHSPFEEDDDF